MSTKNEPAGDYFWLPNPFSLGGYWSSGSGAGFFALDPRMGATARVPFPAAFFPTTAGCATHGEKEPDHTEAEYAKPVYPEFIPRRWIYLSEHAKKARTRKKWKHAIARKTELYAKRRKGATT